MKYDKVRKLGTKGANICPIGFGAMSLTNFYGPCNDMQADKILNKVLDLGINHIDTSNVYGGGTSESRIGEFLAKQGKQKNNLFVIATKAAICRDPETGVRSFNNTEKHLEEELDKSLNRLGVEAIDLFYIHRRDPNIPIEEVTESLVKFMNKGKIKSIGFSEIAPTSLIRASKIHHIAAVQSEYSLSTRSPEMGLLQECKNLGTALVAFSPVGRSFLTDAPLSYDIVKELDFTKNNPRFLKHNYMENIILTDKFREYASDLGVKSASLAIAWLLSKGEHIIPIPGTRSEKHLEELALSRDIDINDKILNEIEKILPIGWAYGDRYSEAQWIGPERYC